MTTDVGYLPQLSSRDDYVDYLEGFTTPTMAELQAKRSTRKLVKTYMLETVAHGVSAPPISSMFPSRIRLDRLDESMFRIHDGNHHGQVIGLLETMDDRHPVVYTTMAALESDRWVHQVVDSNPWLDRLWLSSTILFELWQYVQRTTPLHRYVRLGFDHEAWYETTSVDTLEDLEHSEIGSVEDDDDTAPNLIERRRSKVQLTERLSVLQQSLPELTKLYDPLHSLVQLQMPSGGHGGHLLHFDGKATNRSDSFLEHRATVGLVLNLYRRATEHAEERLWLDTTTVGDDGFRINGAPLLIKFSTPLSTQTFDRFVELGLKRKTSRFRIGGFAQRRGPRTVQMAAIDRHLWQPFLLEATTTHLMAVLPRGTCGNTIHRMVTNVQRFLDPDVDVWLGSERYSTVVADSMARAA